MRPRMQSLHTPRLQRGYSPSRSVPDTAATRRSPPACSAPYSPGVSVSSESPSRLRPTLHRPRYCIPCPRRRTPRSATVPSTHAPDRVALTTHHEARCPPPTEPAHVPNCRRNGGGDGSVRDRLSAVCGIDIAATTFTAAWMPPGGAPTPPVTHPQRPEGYAALQRPLATTGIAPAATLVVLEATGSY